MKVLILAGGFATRLWPLTESRAKPLLILNGKTILAHVVEPLVESEGFKASDIILLTNKKFEVDFQKELTALGLTDATIFCEDAYADGEKLGALGAISAAVAYYDINESILVLAGDNVITDFDPAQMKVKNDEARLTIRSVKDKHEARKFGVVEVNDHKVIGFEEKPADPKSNLVTAGFMSFGKDLLLVIKDFATVSPDALGGIFPELLAQKILVTAYETEGHWFDVGSFETYLEAHKTLQKKSSEVKGDNQLSGPVYVASSSKVDQSILVNTIIYPGCTVKNCRISNSVIDENCHLEGVDLNQKLVRKNTQLIF